MTTARDFELGERPTCASCGRELDVETDCHHDGYEGSPYAHGGRGSYGMGSHHFVFSDYCEFCADAPEPLRAILQHDKNWEWLNAAINSARHMTVLVAFDLATAAAAANAKSIRNQNLMRRKFCGHSVRKLSSKNFNANEIAACLVEGNSIRSTVRITGAAKLTIERLLESAGRQRA